MRGVLNANQVSESCDMMNILICNCVHQNSRTGNFPDCCIENCNDRGLDSSNSGCGNGAGSVGPSVAVGRVCTRVFCARTKWECTSATIAAATDLAQKDSLSLAPSLSRVKCGEHEFPHVTLSGQCATRVLAQGALSLQCRELLRANSALTPSMHVWPWPSLEFCAQRGSGPSGGPLSEFPMRRQNPLLQLLARCVVAGLSSFEWNSNGASFPFKSGRNKKVRPNRFVRSRRPRPRPLCALHK